MKTVFTTVGLHARDRFAYWHDVAERILTGHDSRPGRRDDFSAELRAADLADVGLFSFANGAMSCERARKHIVSGGEGEFFLCRNGGGRFELEQNGRRNVFLPGDMVLIDSNLRYAVEFSDASQMLMLKVPRRILETRFGTMSDYIGVRLDGSSGLVSFVSRTLATLADAVDDLDEDDALVVRNQLVELVTHTFSRMAGEGKRLSVPRALTLIRLKATVEARLADPDFDAAAAARAAGIGVRAANALLEAEGTTLARLIRETRLERCRAALADPLQDQRTIGEIAFSWGVGDLTNFGRMFAAAYGVTPRAYRQRHG